MAAKSITENWKTVKLDSEIAGNYKLQVSDQGNLRSYHRFNDGGLLKGSMTGGYRVLRLKFFNKRSDKTQKQLNLKEKQISKLTAGLKAAKESKTPKKELKQMETALQIAKTDLSALYKSDAKERTINYHALFHKLVAQQFLPKPKKGQTVVSHINHNKTDNRAANLVWMTPAENHTHQQKSPGVLELRKKRREEPGMVTNSKLTPVKVLQIRKQLAKNKTVKAIAEQFSISETQVFRIKKGENWQNVK